MTEPVPTTVIDQVDWESSKEAIMAIRTEVFIREQQVPLEEELDGQDEIKGTQHFLLRINNRPIGCTRLLSSGQIGRMAVLAEYRGSGAGLRLLAYTVRTALGCNISPFLNAQVYAIPFYEKLGFVAEGAEFDDAGIPHRAMQLPITRKALEKIYGDTVYRLHCSEEFAHHISQMATCASRNISIYCSVLDTAIWAQPPLINAISAFARTRNNAKIRILLEDSKALRGSAHPLVRLCQRLTSKMEIRVLEPGSEPPKHAFFSADCRQLVLFNEEANYRGFANYAAPAESQHQLDDFDRLWAYGSARDPDLAELFF